jgi:hypothetical protein
MIRLIPIAFAITLASLSTGCQSTSSPALSAMRPDGQWHQYGPKVNPQGATVLMCTVSGDEGRSVVAAHIVDVCKVKGCWMNVRTEGGQDIFVKFKDYAFFVPMNAAGRQVRMYGDLTTKTVSVSELRHYAEDAKKSSAEIAAITEPQTQLTFIADSVMIEGTGLDAPYQP